MTPSEIRAGATYRGEAGETMRVVLVHHAKVLVYLPSIDDYEWRELAEFAAWAVSEVRDAG